MIKKTKKRGGKSSSLVKSKLPKKPKAVKMPKLGTLSQRLGMSKKRGRKCR